MHIILVISQAKYKVQIDWRHLEQRLYQQPMPIVNENYMLTK